MAPSKKKPVSKDDLRRLMKETKTNVGSLGKKVDHPLAKYNKLGQLVCSLCNTAIKSSLLWPAHIQGRQHKEMLAAPKPNLDSNLQQINLLKRKTNENLQDCNFPKKPKASDEENDSAAKSNLTKSSAQASQPNSSAWRAQLAAACSEESSSEDEAGTATNVNGHHPVTNETTSTSEVTSKSDLPSDFFDDPPNGATKETDSAVDRKISEVLPEGFFDDPIMDAKVRKVEYKDKMEEEWELFQKQMKEESHVSEAIMEEEDEQTNVDRNIDEIDEQMHRWSQINELQNQKEEIMKAKSQKNDDDSDSDDSTALEDYQDLLDWRSKKSWT